MSVTLTFADDALRHHRAQRVARLIRLAAVATMVVSGTWLVFALARGYRIVVVIEVAGILGGVGLLLVQRHGRIDVARHLSMVVLFVLVIGIIALEGNSPARIPVVHLYLIVLAVGAYLVFFDAPPAIPASYAGASLVLFVSRELGWLAFPPLGPDDPIVALMAKHVAFVAVFAIVIALTWMFVRDIATAERHLARANERLETLLEGMLPESVARRLREEGRTFAEACSSCTILFADIVGFTRMASQLSPAEVVTMLDDLFSKFDVQAERIGVEKIKTVGDAYMAVAGVPDARRDHAAAVVQFALAIQDIARDAGIRMRIGINTGPVVAGVIGKKRFIYDLWGDAVNVASDLEASAEPGGIQVTASTRRELADAFELEPRGEIAIAGGRRIHAWMLKPRS